MVLCQATRSGYWSGYKALLPQVVFGPTTVVSIQTRYFVNWKNMMEKAWSLAMFALPRPFLDFIFPYMYL